VSSLTSGSPQLSLFTDGGVLYTGALTANGAQQTGFAGRIGINNALLGDPSRTIVYSTSPLTAAGDTKRSDFILGQLMTGTYRYSPDSGIGTTGTPFTGTLLNFARQVISMQGEAASSAALLADGQEVVLNTLQNKMNATSGVNIDDEMAHLLALQNSYSANARVMATVKDMYEVLIAAM
jgi:flagellar hook-associated protein 1